MAQKVTGYIKLQIPAAKATASPPVGPALGQHGVNIAQFIKEFNERTKDQAGFKIPVVITVYADRSFSFVTKTPPTATLILKTLGIESGSGVPTKTKVATISQAQLREIVVGYDVGDSVKIADGPLTSFIGVVEALDIDKNKVRVIVSMFGRETPVELELDQVETIDP